VARSIFEKSIKITFALFTVMVSGWAEGPRHYVNVEVEPGSVSLINTPAQLSIDFAAQLKRRRIAGVFDPNSVSVEGRDPRTGNFEPVDFRLSEHFKYGDTGLISWVIPRAPMTRFRIGFGVKGNFRWKARDYVPAIGVGDLLLFNTAAPKPLFQQAGVTLVDLRGDGRPGALVNTNYTNSFQWPEDGIFFHLGVANSPVTVGDYSRVQYIPLDGERKPRILRAYYNWAEPVDWDGDGSMDLLFVSFRSRTPGDRPPIETGAYFTFLRNSGRKDAGGMPLFAETHRYPADAVTLKAYVPAVAAADLDNDRRIDLIGLRTSADDGTERLGSAVWYRNQGVDLKGIPLLADPLTLMTTDGKIAGFHASAYALSLGDVNNDGRVDLIGANDYIEGKPTQWYENLGGRPPVFAPRRELSGLPPGGHRWVRWNGKQGLMNRQSGELLERRMKQNIPLFVPSGRLLVEDGPLHGGYQEKPDWVDWDADGDFDLVAGESEGGIQLYQNVGTRRRPRFAAPEPVLESGKPLRIYRDQVLGGSHWHGAMGYPSVTAVDWDRDGLFDLVVPNETNRVFWFKNIGTRNRPAFGGRQPVWPDGYADSPARRARPRRAASDKQVPNHPYPYLDDEPFFWRTRIPIGDFTGDGLLDMVAKSGSGRVVLYERYRTAQGELRLKPGVPLHYDDGAPMDKETAPFFKMREVDWDGDGLMDIVGMQGWGKPSELFLRNVGTRNRPRFARGQPFQFAGEPLIHSRHGLQPSFFDWDGDGTPDLIGCNESGYYLLFRHAALTRSLPNVRIIKDP
jgi:hypothetical protein